MQTPKLAITFLCDWRNFFSDWFYCPYNSLTSFNCLTTSFENFLKQFVILRLIAYFMRLSAHGMADI